PYAMTAGQKTDRLIDSGGRSAMTFIATSVTRPAPPTTTLNVRRRDSHHRKMLAVLRTSAGAGKSKRVRADTPTLRTGHDATYIEPAVASSTLRCRAWISGVPGTPRRIRGIV